MGQFAGEVYFVENYLFKIYWTNMIVLSWKLVDSYDTFSDTGPVWWPKKWKLKFGARKIIYMYFCWKFNGKFKSEIKSANFSRECTFSKVFWRSSKLYISKILYFCSNAQLDIKGKQGKQILFHKSLIVYVRPVI